ncbi:MAG: GntR family transcriptional regulator [Saprospiraceae bacterium]|jgi:DNA-binding transcriptional regulator YhcF (GntR family)
MDFNNQHPIFMQIAEMIMDSVMEKEVLAGERIQSVRDLASHVQVNPNTVMRAFSFLTDQGIIYNQRGVGYFVADDAFDKIKELKKQEFIRDFLPELFRRMDHLNISIDDLKKYKS